MVRALAVPRMSVVAIAGRRQIARGLSNPAAFRGAYQLRRHGELSIELAMHLHPLKVRPTGFQARCQVGGDRADILLQVCLVATHAPSQRLQGAAYVQGYSAIGRFMYPATWHLAVLFIAMP